jgi:DNA-binding transcriptional LysR family regulator
VAYSTELPLTRRFWLAAFEKSFAGDLRLVAPDLRVVVAAVAAGLGVSLLPEFACTDALASGAVVEITDVSDVVAGEPWFACTRTADDGRRPLVRLVAGLRRPDGHGSGGDAGHGTAVLQIDGVRPAE